MTATGTAYGETPYPLLHSLSFQEREGARAEGVGRVRLTGPHTPPRRPHPAPLRGLPLSRGERGRSGGEGGIALHFRSPALHHHKG